MQFVSHLSYSWAGEQQFCVRKGGLSGQIKITGFGGYWNGYLSTFAIKSGRATTHPPPTPLPIYILQSVENYVIYVTLIQYEVFS